MLVKTIFEKFLVDAAVAMAAEKRQAVAVSCHAV
jgi:hypothetical protein